MNEEALRNRLQSCVMTSTELAATVDAPGGLNAPFPPVDLHAALAGATR